jgi:phytoene dehydrogenase-like protein
MLTRQRYDAIIVGSGPNGLSAAIVLAQAGRSVLVVEAKQDIGGGARTRQVTLPGFQHDICSAIHPLGAASPFWLTLPLAQYGLEWIYPEVSLAHPLEDGSAMLLTRSIAETSKTLIQDNRNGRDARVYERLLTAFVANWDAIVNAFLGPLRPGAMLHPQALIPFGLAALQSARTLACTLFQDERARALMAGLCAHSMLPLEQWTSAAPGLILAMAGHKRGWPIARGGSQRIVDALAVYLRSLGGEIVTGVQVTNIDDLPQSRAVLFDITPRQLLQIAGQHLPEGYKRSLQRYRYGPGVFKIDYALDGPIPWRAEECLRAGTVHLGATLPEIAACERMVWQGRPPARPYLLIAQQSLFDPTRAPAGKQTAWVYCHVPSGSTFDMTRRIEDQIERFAPGFRERVLARSTMNPALFEAYSANYVGGDINGGVLDLGQLFTRPTVRVDPYSTPNQRILLCSSSTPPGGGVHGMCGYFAAQSALRGALA